MSQKITYAHIQNFKGIKELEVSNLSRFVAIFWENWAGKTSFLEAIKNAIKLEKWWNSKVKIWEENWLIEVHFEDFKIKRIIGDNWKLEVEHDGQITKRPQEWLDSVFLGTIGDPQKFLNLHNKEKIKYILETQWKKIEFDELELQREILYQKRQDKHRTYLAKKEEIEKTEISGEESIVDNSKELVELRAQLNVIDEENKNYYDLENRIEKGKSTIEWEKNTLSLLEWKIQRLIRDLEEAKNQKINLENNIKKYDDTMKSLVEDLDSLQKKDTAEIANRIEELQKKEIENTEKRVKKEMYQKQIEAMNVLEWERRDLDNQVIAVETKQNSLMEQIQLSYPMRYEDWVMRVKIEENRIPLDDLNTASQLDLWVDICLSWPNKVKIITIENANALDPKTMKRIKEKIEKAEAQCFLETVYKTGYESITIVDWANI